MKTSDSGVAATFRQVCRNGIRDMNQIEADIEYVGHIEEILELNYRRHCVIVFVCDFVKANYREENATIKKDKWGFTLANYERRLRVISHDSFAFPKHCEQVFYCNAREAPGWKIVLRKEIRGKRVLPSNEDEGDPQIFRMGADDEFEGLRPEREVGEGPAAAVATGQNVLVQEVFMTRGRRAVRGRGNPGSRPRGGQGRGRGGPPAARVGALRQEIGHRHGPGVGSTTTMNEEGSSAREDDTDEELFYAEALESPTDRRTQVRGRGRGGERRKIRRRMDSPGANKMDAENVMHDNSSSTFEGSSSFVSSDEEEGIA